jgi:hypothetical protein
VKKALLFGKHKQKLQLKAPGGTGGKSASAGELSGRVSLPS